jgi:hypothetical protein
VGAENSATITDVRVRRKSAPPVNTDLNAFKKCDSTVERVQIMMRDDLVLWTGAQVTASGRVLAPHRQEEWSFKDRNDRDTVP